MTKDRDEYDHAFSNAKGWYEELRDTYRKLEDFRLGLNECGQCDDFEKCKALEMCLLGAISEDEEALKERVQGMPLSIEVRSPWYVLGAKAEDTKPAEYNILLTTGGPALRVWGELDSYGQVDSAQMQMQDWGVPWREVWPCEVEEMDEARAVLMWFAQQFYFGE